MTSSDSMMILGISIVVHTNQKLEVGEFVLGTRQKLKRIIPAGLARFMVDSCSSGVF